MCNTAQYYCTFGVWSSLSHLSNSLKNLLIFDHLNIYKYPNYGRVVTKSIQYKVVK